MESLSTPLHSRKLSNATTFSTKNAYNGIFSGQRRKYTGASPIDFQDYREIFGSPLATSSIPVLDLSTIGEPSDVLSLNLRSSKPDYSTIFGGFRNEDVAVSYEELFARDKARAPSSTTPNSQDSDYLSHQSSDALKQFNMSYNKISQKSKDGLDGTKHVTQLHAVPGYTHFIDEPVRQPKMKSEDVVMDSSKEGESVSEDNFLKTVDINLKLRPSTVSSPSASPTKSVNHTDYPMRSTTIDSESCKTDTFATYFDEELEVNSAASASAAALRKAIEKAQESIRIAKESVGRKKKGLRSFSNKKFKDSVKVEGKLDDVTSATSSQVFPDSMDVKKIFVAKKVIDEINGKMSESSKGYSIPVQSFNKFEDNTSSTEVTSETESRPHESAGKDENATFSSDAVEAGRTYNMSVNDYEGNIEEIKTTNGVLEHQSAEEKLESVERVEVKESNNLFVSQKLEDEKEVSTIEHSMPVQLFNIFKDNTFVSNSTSVTSEKESSLHDSAGKDKHATSCSDEADTESTKIETSDFVHEDQTYTMFVDDHDGKIEVVKTTTGVLEDESVEEEPESIEKVEVDIFRESKENKDEARLINACESVGESNNLSVSQKVENEKEVSQRSDLNDNENELSALENEKQEEVLEQEDVENAENVKSDNGLEEASESKDDSNTEIIKEEETSDDCELKTKEGVTNCDYSVEEIEVNPSDDCEMKQEGNHTVERKGESFDESRDEVFDENSSADDNVVEEIDNIDGIHVASNIVDMNDNNAETTQEEEEFFEKTSVDQTASDDDENEYEVKSEENDVQSESSLGTTHGVKTLEEESSLHKENLPDVGSTNEIKDSREPQCRDNEDEIEKPGPSNVSGKDHFTRIDDEVVAREREREKNRLAVERAIREARERAFAEARERVERERAAVEKATQEVRQRMMADAREKVAKSSLGNQSSSEKTSSQSKLRAERAAVERATSEARQRALEKAMSQKNVSELNKSESALRTKAKLEKHNRIMERAAKALAEKEKRDLLAEKEQMERNRLAENLDADIKRWSKGKEGNLRALLSTLQYILGPESGWQPVSLTEIISTSAVKKSYRKATLCVHPDKLQQRGATIQQKYICEKVFDLLKAAWNRFNSEER